MVVNITLNRGEEYTFLYNAGVPLRGLKNITSFADVITGTTANRFFNKEFRFSIDGSRFSPWFVLTTANLINEIQGGVGSDIALKNDLKIEFRYVRAGSDLSLGGLTLDSVMVNGVYSLAYLQTLDFQDSIFKDISFTDDYWNKVWCNLMDKVYREGIVPKYIERGEDNISDKDYITLFKTLSYWWGLHIALADFVITKMNQNDLLLSEYLRQRGLFICGEEDLSTLQELAQEIYDQARRRGTRLVHQKDGDNINPVATPKHGELLRMICFEITKDEYLWEYIKSGWYVGTNSPTSLSSLNHLQLNKSPFQTKDFPLNALTFFDSVSSANVVTDGSKQVISILADSLITNKIVVNPNIGYVVQFAFRTPTPTTGGSLSLFLEFFDELGNSFLGENIFDASSSPYTDISAYGLVSTNYYFYKAIIYPFGEPLQSLTDASTSWGGQHLRFPNQDIRTFTVHFYNYTGVPSPSELNIWDFKIFPLVYDQSFVSANGLYKTILWLQNNSSQLTDKRIEDSIMEYLIPSNSGLITKFLQ